jgi:hypothetical protein
LQVGGAATSNWIIGTQVTIDATVVTTEITAGTLIAAAKGFELKKNRALFCCGWPAKEARILDW